VTVQNSAFVNNRAASVGGGLVNNNGAVTIIESIFDSNGGGGFGTGSAGALWNSGELTIIRSTFSNNHHVFDSGGLTTTNGIVRITSSRFTKNGGGIQGTHEAGALNVMRGVVLITETTFDHNSSDGPGAILVSCFFCLSPENATLIVSDSAFVENVAFTSGSGAAIFNSGTVQVTNTTFARNSIQAPFFTGIADGIAINNFGTLSLTNSTLAENTAVDVAMRLRPVISSATNARTFLQNTILTHNAEDTFVQHCFGPITSLGNNFISDTAGCAIVLQPTDLTGDAGLGLFSDNGRPGNGHFPLLPTSRAINAANASVCPEKDQIGQPRKPHCDIGAVEFSHKHNELVQNLP
jgi:hypothetical protein